MRTPPPWMDWRDREPAGPAKERMTDRPEVTDDLYCTAKALAWGRGLPVALLRQVNPHTDMRVQDRVLHTTAVNVEIVRVEIQLLA